MIKLLDYFNITVTQLVTFLISVKIFSCHMASDQRWLTM